MCVWDLPSLRLIGLPCVKGFLFLHSSTEDVNSQVLNITLKDCDHVWFSRKLQKLKTNKKTFSPNVTYYTIFIHNKNWQEYVKDIVNPMVTSTETCGKYTSKI